MRQKSFFIEALSFLLISVQIALYVLMWFRLLGDPSLKTMDFIHFYGSGRLARSGNYGQLYDLNAQGVVQRAVVGTDNYDPLMFNHPSYLVPLLKVMATDDYVQAYVWWSIARLVVLIICGELIRRYLLRVGWDRRSAWLAALACMCFFPVFIGLLGGQDTMFTLGGLLVWMFALLKAEEMSAGLGLAFATLSPTIAGALAIPMFASRRQASLWFILGVIALLIYTLLLIGTAGIRDFLSLLQISSQAQYYGFNWSKMYNLVGLLIRTVPALGVDVARVITWISAFLAIFGLCILWWNRKSSLRIEHIGIAVVLTTFTSPHLYLHGLTYLILPMLGLITVFWNKGNKRTALLFIPAVSVVVMFVALLKPGWDFATYYLLMFALVYGLWSNLRREPTPERAAMVSDEQSA